MKKEKIHPSTQTQIKKANALIINCNKLYVYVCLCLTFCLLLLQQLIRFLLCQLIHHTKYAVWGLWAFKCKLKAHNCKWFFNWHRNLLMIECWSYEKKREGREKKQSEFCQSVTSAHHEKRSRDASSLSGHSFIHSFIDSPTNTQPLAHSRIND